jgi:predicted Zn-dependent protease
VFHYFSTDSAAFEAVVTHKDRATGFGSSYATRLEDFDVNGAFDRAYGKAQKGVNPKLVDVGAYTVILEPSAIEEIMFFALWGLNGDMTNSGVSYASDKLGQKVFGTNINVMDDVNRQGTVPRTFDVEGYRRQPLSLIENGVIKNFVHDSKTAHKAGVKPSGHAITMSGEGGFPLNVVMAGGSSSVEEMIKTTERGILVTHFHYTNFVNPKTLQITGLTRDGTFMIENGKIAFPVMNMRFTENLTEAFSNVTAISAERERVGQYGIGLFPAVKIENFHFTSGQK